MLIIVAIILLTPCKFNFEFIKSGKCFDNIFFLHESQPQATADPSSRTVYRNSFKRRFFVEGTLTVPGYPVRCENYKQKRKQTCLTQKPILDNEFLYQSADRNILIYDCHHGTVQPLTTKLNTVSKENKNKIAKGLFCSANSIDTLTHLQTSKTVRSFQLSPERSFLLVAFETTPISPTTVSSPLVCFSLHFSFTKTAPQTIAQESTRIKKHTPKIDSSVCFRLPSLEQDRLPLRPSSTRVFPLRPRKWVSNSRWWAQNLSKLKGKIEMWKVGKANIKSCQWLLLFSVMLAEMSEQTRMRTFLTELLQRGKT